MADGYRAQLNPASSPTFNGASAEDFGAGVGRALQYAGETMDRIADRERERQQDEEAASAGLALAQAQGDLNKVATDARLSAAPGAVGHSEAIGKAVDERIAANLESIRNPKVKAAMATRYADLKTTIVGQEYGWETGKRVEKLVTDFDDQGTLHANNLEVNPTPGGLVTSLEGIRTAGELLSVPADAKDKLIKQQQRKVVNGWGQSLADKDPTLLLNAIQSGTLNPYVEPEDIDRLRSAAGVELRRREAAARQATATGEATARESISVLGKRVAAGDLPTDDEFKAAADLAKKYDLKGPAFDLATWQSKVLVNRSTRDWTPAQFASSIAELEAKGEKRTTAENVQLEQLKSIRGQRESAFNNDPHLAAATAGNPAPPIALDGSDPATVQNRVTWARAYARSTGLQAVPYLNRDELKSVRDLAATGPAGQLEAASRMRGLFGVAVGQEIMRQVDPNNRDLQLYVGLPPATAQLVRRGQDALQRNPKLFDSEGASAIFAEFKAAIPQDLQTPVWNAARAIAAGRADEMGYSDADLTNGNGFRGALQRAVGLNSGGGGFADWKGGKVWLPQDVSAAEFEKRMTRATPTALLGAVANPALGSPHYMGADGKLVPLRGDRLQRLGQYRLETVNPGIYNLVGPDGGHLVGKNGQPWAIDVRKLGAR